jgi:hypothetical protein
MENYHSLNARNHKPDGIGMPFLSMLSTQSETVLRKSGLGGELEISGETRSTLAKILGLQVR